MRGWEAPRVSDNYGDMAPDADTEAEERRDRFTDEEVQGIVDSINVMEVDPKKMEEIRGRRAKENRNMSSAQIKDADVRSFSEANENDIYSGGNNHDGESADGNEVQEYDPLEVRSGMFGRAAIAVSELFARQTGEEEGGDEERLAEALAYCVEKGELPDGLNQEDRIKVAAKYILMNGSSRTGEAPKNLTDDEEYAARRAAFDEEILG